MPTSKLPGRHQAKAAPPQGQRIPTHSSEYGGGSASFRAIAQNEYEYGDGTLRDPRFGGYDDGAFRVSQMTRREVQDLLRSGQYMLANGGEVLVPVEPIMD